MGVHLTFVRSVDLDEWTQRQIDSMRIGGNENCRKFFRKQGCSDDIKSEKKYTSRAAVAYKAELIKLVDAEAAKRGEVPAGSTASAPSSGGGSLLDNLDATMQKQTDDEARRKLDEARNGGGGGGSAGTLQPSAKLASSMAGSKGKLTMTKGSATGGGGLKTGGLLKAPSTTGGPKLVMRKPSSQSASARMLKKSSSVSSSKLRVNRISPATSAAGGDGGMDSFEDIEKAKTVAEETKRKEEEEKKRQAEEDAKLAKKLQAELNVAAAPKPAAPAKPAAPKMSAHQENLAKLGAMNSDFFSGM